MKTALSTQELEAQKAELVPDKLEMRKRRRRRKHSSSSTAVSCTSLLLGCVSVDVL